MAMVESANKEISREKQRADNYYALLEEARKALENKNAENAELKRRIAELEQFKDAAAFAEKNCVDAAHKCEPFPNGFLRVRASSFRICSSRILSR